MQELTDNLAKSAGIEGNFSGVYVAEVQSGGAADIAGIKSGDIIMSIDSILVKSPSDIQEKINAYRPNDNISITLLRNGEVKTLQVQLQGRGSTIAVASPDGKRAEMMGAVLENAPSDLLNRLRLKGGVQITSLKKGKFKDAGIKEGLVITHINQVPVASAEEVFSIISKARRSVLVEGVYPNGSVYYYGVGV